MGNELPPMKDTGPAVSPAMVASLEQAIGAALPGDYRAFLLATNGRAHGQDAPDVPPEARSGRAQRV
jgi:hypothetical protein